MNIFERSRIVIYRKKRTYLFLFLLAIILINIVIGGLAIQKTMNGVSNIIEKESDISAIISSRVVGDNNYLEINKIHEIGQLEYVDRYNYNIYLDFEAIDMNAYNYDLEEHIDDTSANFSIKGVNDSSFFMMKDIEEILAGQYPSEDDFNNGRRTILISDKLSSANKLSIGDTIRLRINTVELIEETYRLVAGSSVISSNEYDFEIVGIYASKIYDDFHDIFNNSSEIEKYNQILTLNSNIMDIFENQLSIYDTYYAQNNLMMDKINSTIIAQYEPEFFLNKWDEREKFAEKANSLLPNGYLIYLRPSIMDKIIDSVNNMNKLSILILIISVISSIIIIIGVFLLFIKNRMREFGILLALGETKIKIILQLVLEILFIIWVALGVSLVTGNILSTKLVDIVLEQEVIIMDEVVKLDMSNDEFYMFCKLSVNEYFFKLLIGSGAIILIGVSIPSLIILRLSPRKILL